MITLQSKRYTIVATGTTLDSRFPNGSDPVTDPYAAYATRYVNAATGTDSTGESIYASLPFAVNDYLTAGGRRLLVQGTHTLASTVTFPVATGVGTSARLVIQGDPASAMPTVHCNGYGVEAESGDHYVVLYWLEIDGDQATGTGFGVTSANNSLVERCIMHGMRPTGTGNGGCIYYRSGAASGHVVRDCILYDVKKLADGLNNENCCGIIAYGHHGVTVDNCTIYNMHSAIRVKQASSAAYPNGWTVTNNIFHTVQLGLSLTVAGAGDPRHEGHVFTGNLVYASNVGVYAECNETVAQSTDLTITGNSFAEDCLTSFMARGVTAVTFTDNAVLCSSRNLELKSAASPNSWLNTLSSNYNAFYNVGNFMLDLYGVAEHSETTLAGWKTVDTDHTRAELTGDPDANSIGITSLSTEFTATASRDYSLKVGSSLIGAGTAAGDIGYDATDCGSSL